MSRIPYMRGVRNRVFLRLRYSDIVQNWLEVTAKRLGITEDEVFNLLKAGKTASQISEMDPEISGG